MKKLKILIVLPEGQKHRIPLGDSYISFREAPLTATMLAALVPADLDADVTIVDESVSPVPFKNQFDLVAISILTGTSIRGYEIAKHFKMQGSYIVIGGVHATLRPEEAGKFADTVVSGFAERTWPVLLKDYKNNTIKKFYNDDASHIKDLPMPRRDLQNKFGYMMPYTVFATRGCRSKCSFCSVPVSGFEWHKRPVDQVIDEIKKIPAKRFAFNDVNLTDDPEYAKELFKALIPLKKKWGGLASTTIAKNEELLELMAQSGCGYLLIGFESSDPIALTSIRKGFNRAKEYQEVMFQLHKQNIIVQGCFIFGLDGEGVDVFDRTVALADDLKIDIPRYAVFTPYPETPAYHKLKSEGRILHEHWQYYDTQHVVFQPLNMTPEELDRGFIRAYEKSFSMKSILRRTIATKKNFPVTLAGNTAYRMYVRKLKNERNRFPVKI